MFVCSADLNLLTIGPLIPVLRTVAMVSDLYWLAMMATILTETAVAACAKYKAGLPVSEDPPTTRILALKQFHPNC